MKNIIYLGYNLQDNHTLQDYSIVSDLNIIVNLRLRGGCSGTRSKGIGYFKGVAKGKEKA